MRAAFGQPGALERVITVPAGTVPGSVALHLRLTELLVHGWDLARATGQSVTGLPADLAEQELAFSRAQLDRMPRDRRPFASPAAGDRRRAGGGPPGRPPGPPGASPDLVTDPQAAF